MNSLRFFHLVCAFLAAYCAAALWRDHNNTLQLYPEWKSAKAELALGVNGAQAFSFTPISLLGRALNLGAWHGQQELRLEKTWSEFPELRARIRAEGLSEWSLIARSVSGKPDFAVRLSNQEGRPSAWLKLGRDREILSRSPIGPGFGGGGWRLVKLRKEGSELTVWLDGNRIGARTWPEGSWRISLRGQSEEGRLQVDDLELKSPQEVYEQSFSGSFPWWLFFLSWSVFFLFLFALVRAGLSGLAVSAALALGALSLLLILLFDSLIGNQYPMQLQLPVSSKIESRTEVLQRLEVLPPGQPVLLWLGGSQAWGAGASRPELSAFGRLQAALHDLPAEMINGAASGTLLEDQLEPLRLVSTRRKLEALVLTAGVNDAQNTDFLSKLRLVASAAKQRGAGLLLVVEPVDFPVREDLQKRQAEMRAFASSEGIPLVDLQAVFEREKDSAYLWWDVVHFTDAGAALAARELEGPIRELLKP